MKKTLARAVLAAGAVGLIAFAMAAGDAGVGNAGMSLSASGWSSRLTAEQVRVLSANADQRVIVLLRDQHSALGGQAAVTQRAQAFASDRAPIVAQLRQLRVPRLVTYRTVSAVATTVSAAEAANLRRDPAVLAVDPDAVVKGPSSNANLLPGAIRPTASSRKATRSGAAAASTKAVCGTASAPLLEPEALHLINADNRTNANSPLTSGPKSAHSLGYTGAGVNVAVFPDGMDPSLPDFQRNGQSAITDYRDFTGEGTGAPTGGGEAFGDVSSLVAQGRTTYNLDQQINPAFARSGGTCDVKVLGVAPGANVAVMKVFGNSDSSFTSEILQGIDWAIQHDHVNILSISLGFFGAPSTAAEQPLTAILKNAIADGTVVVASTGDSSPSNTEQSPALNPGVIGTAASTSYRLLAQTNEFLYNLAGVIHQGGGTPSYQLGQSTAGWLDNEVSTLSSSGVTEERRVPDIIAPGDLNWADCSTDTTTYTDCENALGGTTIGLEDFGGTSESAPLTSGVAALVIQAYRGSHGGKTPSPAAVRQIIFSSATDLGVAAENQGSGLLNALRAVQLAKAYGKHAKSGGLVHSPDWIADLGNAKGSHRHTVTIKNTGNSKATIKPVLRTLGPAHTLAGGKLNLFQGGAGQGSCAGLKTALYFNGETIPELNCKTFKVPKGVDLLDSRIGWDPLQNCPSCTAGEPTAREILIDPKGRYGQYSDPQGDGAGFADEQIHQPAAGKWTVLIFGRATSNYEGPVSYQEITQKFRTVKNAVKPAAKKVRPGKSASFTVKVPEPTKPGFFTGAVVFHSNRQSKLGTIPVVSEAKVPVTTKKAGHFTGTLIGGNGRPSPFAQELSYELVVPKGVHDLDVNLTAGHKGYLLLGQLVDPNGNAVDSQIGLNQVDAFGNIDVTNAVQLVWANPTPGTWRVNVANGLFFLPGLDVYSGLTHATLHGTVSFNTSKVATSGLPSGTLTPGSTVTAHVQVKNTGVEPETYQLDPRTTRQTQYTGVSEADESGTLPIPVGTGVPQYLVPPFSSQLKVSAHTTGTTPIQFDISPFWGTPDILSPVSSSGTTSVILSNPFASEWAPAPTEVGPFSASATSEDYSMSASLTTLGFDNNVVPSTGDIWNNVVGGGKESINPLFLLPGQSGTMSVTFTVPSGAAGTTVTGQIPVETFNYNSLPDVLGVGDWSSDVLKVLTYSYTLG